MGMGRVGHNGFAVLLAALSVTCFPSLTQAQALRLQQSQADAARRMIELGVEQGIASLPPSTGQSFSYEYSPERDTYVRTKHLGPTVLRSPDPLRNGAFSLRLAASYFEIDKSFKPIDYQTANPQGVLFTKFGLDARVRVALLNLAASYGITNRIEARISVPVVFADARAQAKYLVSKGDANTQPPSEVDLAFLPDRNRLNQQICPAAPTCTLVYRQDSFKHLGLDSFGEGTNVGVGRISAGVKALLYKGQRVEVAVEPDLFFPSPNEAQLAGSNSFAVLPRVVGAFTITEWLRFYTDIGYDYDFDVQELRRFVWNSGASMPVGRWAFDVGVGGSEFQKAIKWTPDAAPVIDPLNPRVTLGRFDKLADEDNALATTFLDFLLGVKMQIAENVVLSAAVVVPVDDAEFRPAALGTLAIEVIL